MKKSVALLILLSITSLLNAQSIEPAESQIHFFKVWNYVKYYHPSVAGGSINADTLFLQNIGTVDQIKTTEEFNAFVSSFLDKLPKAENKKPFKSTAKLLTKNRDKKWFTSGRLFNKSNKKKLVEIFENRYTDSIHHYISDIRYIPDIPNEPEYPFAVTENIPYKFRMLTLAKIQGAVDYLFPHKYLMDKNFDSLLKTKLPLAVACKTRQEHEVILLELVAAFDDTHAFKFIKQAKFREQIFRNSFFPPFKYVVFDDRIVVTEIILPDYCAKADIKVGDAIVEVNGEPVTALLSRTAKWVSVSNRATLRHYFSDYIRNLVWQSETKDFELTVMRDRSKTLKAVEFVYNRDAAGVKRITDYINSVVPDKRTDMNLDIISGDIAYFKIGETFRFIETVPDDKIFTTTDSIMNIAARQKGIILDMRNYPDWGGFVFTLYKNFGRYPNRFADYFEINKKEIGTFILNNNYETYNHPDIKADGGSYNGKVVIIVNPETLSMSEWNVMNLQNIFPQSITIGEQSAGADGDEKMLMLPGGYKMNFTGNAIFYTNGTSAQRKGVRIDKYMPSTPENLLNTKDYLLDEAIRLIKN
ncbi:S41 family peptidase [Flavobacterium sp. MFBS3-15]|uniref:S41 family peptidase n=1 Tax=Flavobacterium sp. MFBS3-15 TaxID=2989816 RepID=UPI0022358675|nr:S41 family peptidase [Flavobacterium sp. MFBS3-15]MCW4470702.1 S41 family peptidase [Flavobacterium sp. MFBS3-15]